MAIPCGIIVPMVIKNNSHDAGCVLRDAGLGNEDCPIFADCSALSASGARQAQDLKFKAQGWGREVDGDAEFEVLRLRANFGAEEHPEGWTPNGGDNIQGPRSKVHKANIEHPRTGAWRSKDGVPGWVTLRVLRPVWRWLFTFCHRCSHSSALFTTKILFGAPTPVREGSGQEKDATRVNYLKLA